MVDPENQLVVSNPDGNPLLPPDGEIVAVPGCNDEGELVDVDGNELEELEKPISELDFLRPRSPLELFFVVPARRPYVGRRGAEVLGKALFWDMQVGSDGVQACATCHFHAGVDNRTRNQLNPNDKGGDHTLQLHDGTPNLDLQASDFPFHRLANPDIPGEPLLNPGNVIRDSNDVMSSMGVRFRKFRDVLIGPGAFGARFVGGVRPLLPDLALDDDELGSHPPVPGPAPGGAAQHTDDLRARRSTSTTSGMGAPDTTPTAAACSVRPIPSSTSSSTRGSWATWAAPCRGPATGTSGPSWPRRIPRSPSSRCASASPAWLRWRPGRR